MNLKMKLKARATAVVQILDDNTAIYSDECSPTYENTLMLVEAKSYDALKAKLIEKAQVLAAETSFDPVIVVIRDDKHEIVKLEKTQQSIF